MVKNEVVESKIVEEDEYKELLKTREWVRSPLVIEKKQAKAEKVSAKKKEGK